LDGQNPAAGGRRHGSIPRNAGMYEWGDRTRFADRSGRELGRMKRNRLQTWEKNVPPEAAAASPIHRNYQPAGQLHIMRLPPEEQPRAPDF
jgi:hypothetical protein